MKFYLFFFLSSIMFGCNGPSSVTKIDYEPVTIENETNREWIEGWLQVKENRDKNETNIIEIPFVYSEVSDSLKSINTPILVMSGGPGNGSLHMANGFTYSAVGSQGDVLVMDQRGTLRAKPYLSCPEIDSARITALRQGLYGNDLNRAHIEAVKLCYDRWVESGTDLDGYHTLESVQDIEDLRSLLEIDKLILYGMSYSCKLMAAYATTYPDRVEAIILDSPLPHDSNYDEEAYATTNKVFRSVLEHFSEDDDLFNEWTMYIESVQDTVFMMELDSLTLHYTSNEVIEAAMNYLGGHRSLKQLPEVVRRLIRSDHEDVRDVLQSYLGTGRQAKGMRYSTWIAEELPDESQENITSKSEAIPWLKNYPVNDVSFQIADNWKVKSIYESKHWPDKSYVGPVMILSGEFDPWTPVAYGEKMKEKFPQALLKIYPEHTHLPGFTRKGTMDIFEFLQTIQN